MTKPSPERPKYVPAADRPPELPLEAAHHHIEAAVDQLEPPRVRHAARSAFANLRGSWMLHPVDAEMSLFRAITAEEEAASALIRALKQQCYPGSERLKDRHHPHKAAIWPMILAVREMMIDKNMTMPFISVSTEGPPQIELAIDIGGPAKLDQPLWTRPVPPFEFVMHSDKHGPFEVHDFTLELASIAKGRGATTIKNHIIKQANLRNECLYASEKGIPAVIFKDELILDRRARVTAILIMTIAVMQTSDHQSFIVQCLSALLTALEGIEAVSFAYPVIHPLQERLELRHQPDGSVRASVIRPKITGWSFGYTIVPNAPRDSTKVGRV